MSEIWKDIKSSQGYQVSNYGRVWSKKSNLVLQGSIDRYGYRRVTLRMQGGMNQQCAVHRLVTQVFIGDIPKGYEVNHINGNKMDNHVDNLEIVTHRENIMHAFSALGRSGAKGERSGQSKLTASQVREICTRYRNGMTHRELGEMFGVSHVAIGAILSGKTWTHVTEDFLSNIDIQSSPVESAHNDINLMILSLDKMRSVFESDEVNSRIQLSLKMLRHLCEAISSEMEKLT